MRPSRLRSASPSLSRALAAAGLRVGTCVRDITPISPRPASAYEAAFGGTGSRTTATRSSWPASATTARPPATTTGSGRAAW